MPLDINNPQDFIKKLQRERTDYKYASQVRTIAKSILQLSVGIYTEPERFVYELLQNAVDAFSDSNNSSLEILIRTECGRFIFMHNGNPFTEKDVEGICDVGNGTKAKDSKKIGYKGIGFKSVFMPSVSRVSVLSSTYCFEFDKARAMTLMPTYPASEGTLGPNDIPWQVIPIDASHLKSEKDSRYNVVTIVHTPEADKIASKIESLFSDLQFLLFLRCNKVNIRFERNGQHVFEVGKIQTPTNDTHVTHVKLCRENSVDSSWLVFNKAVSVPPEIKAALEIDFNTPDKLKGADNVEISFAVQVEQDKVVALKNTSVFTFLPTSYKGLRQPFLINSNFITDAGRQQLHQESEWNKLIFGKIPWLYLEFVSKFSSQYENYHEVLPALYPDTDTLVREYRRELNDAFDSMSFIPNKKGNKLLKIGEVIIDKTGVSDGVISIDVLLKYLNNKYSATLTNDCFVNNVELENYSHSLINIIDCDALLDILGDRDSIKYMSLPQVSTLIQFLYEFFNKPENNTSEYLELLSDAEILIDEDGNWRRTCEIFLPSTFKEQVDEAADVAILNQDIFDKLKGDQAIINWLITLGVRELSSLSFVDYLLDNPDYVTVDNAISIGRFLFNVWKEDNFVEKPNYADRICNIKFLTKNSELKPICTLYLGSVYDPEDDVESIYPSPELYVADDYIENDDSEDWSYFLKKCGAIHKIGIAEQEYKSSELQFPFITSVADTFKDFKHSKSGYWGYKNPIGNIHFRVSYFTFIDYRKPNYDIDKFIFSSILSRDKDIWETNDKVYGFVAYWGNRIEQKLIKFAPYEFRSQYSSYLEYIIANEQHFPTTAGTSAIASDIYINNPSIVELCGKYLPVLAIESKVHDSWRSILPFKQHISLQDLLTILEKVSGDNESDKDYKRERVSRIYREIIDRGEEESEIVRDWGKNNLIMSHSGEFLKSSELTYITVDGFNNTGSKVFCEKVVQGGKEKLLTLLKTLGVKVITSKDITPSFCNAVENNELRRKLVDKLPYIATINTNSKEDFDSRKEVLNEKIQSSRFFRCESIALSYGEANDTIAKSTFSHGDGFYFTGSLTPARIEPLMAPLCNFLGLGASNDSKLMIILLTDDHGALCDYLKDRGYSIEHLEEPVVSVQTREIGRSNVEHVSQLRDEFVPSVLEQDITVYTEGKEVLEPGKVDSESQAKINKEVRIKAHSLLKEHGYDVSLWDPELATPDVVGLVKNPDGLEINVVIRSAKQRLIHLSASSFEVLMSSPKNLLIVENNSGIKSVTFEELFGNNSNVNLIFDANYTPLEYFKALGLIFKYVKNTEFVIRDPNYSAYDDIRSFGLDVKNDGAILTVNLIDI